MCFSPAASFTAAAVTAALGLIAISRAKTPRDLPLAVTPVLFAIQQAVEGVIWLRMPVTPHATLTGPLVLAYLIFAQAFWPIFSPLAMWCLEPNASRRRLIPPFIAVGAAVSVYMLWGLLTGTPVASVGNMHIVYGAGQVHMTLAGAAYLAVVTLPLFMSSYRSVVIFGAIVTVGWLVAYVAYLAAFQSVWCFFAAIASMAVIGHFEVVRRRAPQLGLA
jgi:hypothetical protein